MRVKRERTETDVALMIGIGQRVRMIRESRGWAATKIDAAAQCGRGRVGRIEKGERLKVSALTLIRIAAVLDVDLHWLVYGRTHRELKGDAHGLGPVCASANSPRCSISAPRVVNPTSV